LHTGPDQYCSRYAAQEFPCTNPGLGEGPCEQEGDPGDPDHGGDRDVPVLQNLSGIQPLLDIEVRGPGKSRSPDMVFFRTESPSEEVLEHRDLIAGEVPVTGKRFCSHGVL
jgi:hypothetical protein